MLCHNCCNALISTHTLILKALESQKFFKEKYSLQIKFETDNLTINTSTDHNRLGDIKYAPREFETVLVEKIELEPIIDDHFVYDDADEEVPSKPTNRVQESAIVVKPIRTKTRSAKSKTEIKADEPLKEYSNHSLERGTSKKKRTVKVKKSKTVTITANNVKSITTESANSQEQKQEECNYNETDSKDDVKTEKEGGPKNVEPKVKKKYKEKKKPRMCSICCKYLLCYQ